MRRPVNFYLIFYFSAKQADPRFLKPTNPPEVNEVARKSHKYIFTRTLNNIYNFAQSIVFVLKNYDLNLLKFFKICYISSSDPIHKKNYLSHKS